jgi:uncharacterized membrane protein YtjA (UPF0391 family)
MGGGRTGPSTRLREPASLPEVEPAIQVAAADPAACGGAGVSVVAGIFGFTGLSAASADIARLLFYIFVVIFLVLLILGLTIFRV